MFRWKNRQVIAIIMLLLIMVGLLMSIVALRSKASACESYPEVKIIPPRHLIDGELSKGDKSNLGCREVVYMGEFPVIKPGRVDILAMSEKVNSTSLAAEADKKACRTPEDLMEEIRRLERYFDVPLAHEIQDYIFELCEVYDLEPALIIGVIRLESTFKVSNVGDGGASLGLMQIQRKWHLERMEKLGCDDLLDPYQNILVGMDYLAELMAQRGSLTWALMAYNGGPSYANSMAAEGSVSGYARAVLGFRDYYRGQ